MEAQVIQVVTPLNRRLTHEQKLAALRNRENQRRSRARRKDYIQELEQRLRQYENAGVKATAEVQAAARKVAEENISLRSLLGIYGVDSQRVDDFLRTGDASPEGGEHWREQGKEAAAQHDSPSEKARLSTLNGGQSALRLLAGVDHDKGTEVVRDPAPTNLPDVDSNQMAQGGAPRIRTTLGSVDLTATQPTSRASPAGDTGGSSAPFAAPLSITKDPDLHYSANKDEISCVAAAEIIASMRGHDNPEEVWPELGCSTSRACMVKNMAIFQIMDQ